MTCQENFLFLVLFVSEPIEQARIPFGRSIGGQAAEPGRFLGSIRVEGIHLPCLSLKTNPRSRKTVKGKFGLRRAKPMLIPSQIRGRGDTRLFELKQNRNIYYTQRCTFRRR